MVQKGSEYDKKRRKVLLWGFVFVIGALLVFALFVGKIMMIQANNVEEFQQIIKNNYRTDTIQAARGNIYSSDGTIIATTVMRYDVHLDFKTIQDSLYLNNIGALTDSLGAMFNKPAAYFRKKFDKQRARKNQYYLLVRGLNFNEFDRIRKFPIFKEGQNDGGFIVDRKYRRELSTDEIGRGTIGIDRNGMKSGFEGAFSQYLTGTNGTRLEKRITSRQWKPINYWKEKEPIDGDDVYTTLDLRIQDIAHSALEKQLIKFEAHHGTAVVMEVATGKIRAMVNLRKNEEGKYVDAYNYAMRDAAEPGSLFKTVSMLAAMEDGFVDENTEVNIGGIRWTYQGQVITDSHRGDVYDISEILAHSSNIGAAKVITKYYADDPKIFYNHLRDWKLFDKMNIELPGITAPNIVTPQDDVWSPGALASISFGYTIAITPLQLVTFYNGIANGGKMLKPLFIDKIMHDGKTLFRATPQVMIEKMASDKAIKMITDALTDAVEEGTARSIYTPNLKMAGKTGTARFEYWKPGPMKYNAGFAGFFPADNPKYTCIVVVNQPNTSIGFYGSQVAAPVFKEIAGKIFLKTPLNVNEEYLVQGKVDLKTLLKSRHKVKIEHHKMPDLVGMIGENVIPQLENLGYRVEYKGAGKVLKQFPVEGTLIKNDQKIYLTLQN